MAPSSNLSALNSLWLRARILPAILILLSLSARLEADFIGEKSGPLSETDEITQIRSCGRALARLEEAFFGGLIESSDAEAELRSLEPIFQLAEDVSNFDEAHANRIPELLLKADPLFLSYWTTIQRGFFSIPPSKRQNDILRYIDIRKSTPIILDRLIGDFTGLVQITTDDARQLGTREAFALADFLNWNDFFATSETPEVKVFMDTNLLGSSINPSRNTVIPREIQIEGMRRSVSFALGLSRNFPYTILPLAALEGGGSLTFVKRALGPIYIAPISRRVLSYEELQTLTRLSYLFFKMGVGGSRIQADTHTNKDSRMMAEALISGPGILVTRDQGMTSAFLKELAGKEKGAIVSHLFHGFRLEFKLGDPLETSPGYFEDVLELKVTDLNDPEKEPYYLSVLVLRFFFEGRVYPGLQISTYMQGLIEKAIQQRRQLLRDLREVSQP